MRIKQIISQHRRDFTADYECETCGHVARGTGYDDAHFHRFVIPAMLCAKCGKAAPPDYEPRGTKYPEGFQV